jgi:heme/copper-type cytochrome/quinol oxidase subunit 2
VSLSLRLQHGHHLIHHDVGVHSLPSHRHHLARHTRTSRHVDITTIWLTAVVVSVVVVSVIVVITGRRTREATPLPQQRRRR